jgi:hypothetical protein
VSIPASWQPRIMFYRSAANVRLLPAGLYVLLAACKIVSLERGNVFSLAGQILIVYWVARFRMRTPHSAVTWGQRYRPLPDYLQHDKIKPEAKVVPGTRASARVRGRLTSPVVMVSSRTALAWNENSRARDVQWAHESAHIAMGDAFVYYILSTAVGVALVNQVLGNWRNISTEILLVTTALIALISLRSYCRTRELVADSISSVILGDETKNELAHSVILDANRLPLFRTHPRVDQRLAVLDNPIAMLNGSIFFYFAAGYMSVPVAIALQRVLREWVPGEVTVFASLAIVSIIIGWATSRHSAVSVMVSSKSRCIAAFLMLSIGELSSMAMHYPARTHHFLVIVCWSILAALLAALIGKLIGIAVALFSVVEEKIRGGNFLTRVIPRLRVLTGLLMAGLWMLPWFR